MSTEVGSETTLSAIERVDAALVYLTELPTRSPEIETTVFGVAEAALEQIDVGWPGDENDPVEALVTAAAGSQGRRFLAIVLLRLLGAHPAEILGTAAERKVCDLFDDAFAGTVYEDKRLPKDLAQQPNYAKTAALRDLAPSLETELEEVVESLRDLRGIDGLRASLIKLVRRPAADAIFTPFIPRQLVRGDVEPALKACSAYVDAENETALDRHERALSAVEGLIQGARAQRTSYSALFERLGMRVKELLEADFGDHPINAPAELALALADKKYPLDAEDTPIAVRVALTNRGPGVARDVTLRMAAEAVSFEQDERKFSTLTLGTREVVFDGRVRGGKLAPMVLAELTWESGRGQRSHELLELELGIQTVDIDWSEYEFDDPYSLMPVASEDELAGRSAQLRALLGAAKSPTPRTIVISGQKRVGKTSVLNALASEIGVLAEAGLVSINIAGGDIVASDTRQFVPRFGRAVCDELRLNPRFGDLDVPDFEDSLSPLKTFGRRCARLDPNFRLVLAVDEFDLLPVELYRPGTPADTFFASLRVLTAEPWLRMILVGSERIQVVMAEQGSHLNNVDELILDYFARDRDFEDFRRLIADPTAGVLEFTEGAIARIYDWVAGHPYFAKYVCKQIFQRALASQDAHVTDGDVESAVKGVLADLNQVRFSHFWADGIVERDPEKAAIVENRRRRVLHSLSEHLNGRPGEMSSLDLWADTDDVIRGAVRSYGLATDEATAELQRFVERRVLVRQGQRVRPRIPLFGHWLNEHGRERIPLSFTDEEAVDRYRSRVSSLQISRDEVQSLVGGWPEYRGKRLSAEDVLAWLGQFGEEREQRLVFPILQNLTFLGDEVIRQRLAAVHRRLATEARERRTARGDRVVRKVERRADIAKARRREWLVTYLGATASSGNRFARLYAQENKILITENVVPLARVAAAIEASDGLLGAVAADDFLGSGFQGVENVELLAKEHPEFIALLRDRELELSYVVALGFDRAAQLVERRVEDLDLPLQLHVAKLLGDEHRVFGDSSIFYPDEDDRAEALRLIASLGERLEPGSPLGFRDTGAAVVFEDSCPNNTLPVLRKAGRGKFKWRPLFER